MKYLFTVLLFLHGIIHLLGFVKAFKLAPVDQLKSPVSRSSGFFWLLTSLFFIVSGIAFLCNVQGWYLSAFIAVIISTILIIPSWKDAKFGTIPNLIILMVIIIDFASFNFWNVYRNEVTNNLLLSSHVIQSELTETDIQTLPEPVKKYIRYTGAIGKPKVTCFKIEFTGKLRKDNESEWMPFSSVQYNFLNTSTRLFFLNATMKHLPVAGFHCFINGNASMDIRLFSLFKVQYETGKEMGIAETVTFFNDMCCMAPATLIDKRIKWISVEKNRVKASFTNNHITITGTLYFNDKGELTNFISADRYATLENGEMQKIPWSTPLKNYKRLKESKLATDASTIYNYPSGVFCYGTFNLTNIEYNCTK